MTIFCSVITPTFNGAITLPRAYQSLLNQSFKDFEWIVVDDGSTDGTLGVVENIQKTCPFQITYFYQENAHKKTAVNQGVKLAKGDFTLVLDDDDELTSDALENAYMIWSNLSLNDAANLSGITGLCVDSDNRVVGSLYPKELLVSTEREMQLKYGMHGERLAIKKTNIRQKFPFPENISGYVPEGLIWARIDRSYSTIYTNKVFRIYHPDRQLEKLKQKGLEARQKCFGRGFYYKELLEKDFRHYLPFPRKLFILVANYIRYSLHQGSTLVNIVFGVEGLPQKFLTSLLLLPGYLAYLKDHS